MSARGWGKALIAGFGVTVVGGALSVFRSPAAMADRPRPWEIGMQTAASPIQERIDALHNEILIIIALIVLFVLSLLAFVVLRFNARRNPTPTRTAHNTAVEVTWTVAPVLLLVVIAIPSFRLMYYMDRTPEAELTLKITSHQWYWTYAYPDQGDLSFDSNIIPEEQLKPGQLRLLDVDNRAVVPVDTTIRLLVTSGDVIHSFFVPSLGVQVYAIPGRLNEAWTLIRKEGVYYGQCNQLCGVNHAFMPIAIQAVSKADFAKWLAEAQKKSADRLSSGEKAAPLAAAANIPATLPQNGATER